MYHNGIKHDPKQVVKNRDIKLCREVNEEKQERKKKTQRRWWMVVHLPRGIAVAYASVKWKRTSRINLVFAESSLEPALPLIIRSRGLFDSVHTTLRRDESRARSWRRGGSAIDVLALISVFGWGAILALL